MNTKVSISNIMKLVNILFLIVLENFVLDCGMGYFSIAFLLLFFIYQFLIGGVQNTIAKMVSIRNNKGFVGNTRLILRPCIIYTLIISVLVILSALFGADAFCLKVWGTTFAAPTIKVLSLAFLFHAVTDVICGYQIGNNNAVILNIANLFKTILPIVSAFFIIPSMETYGNKIASLMKNTVITSGYYALGIACIYLLSAVIVLLVVIVLSIRLRHPYGNNKAMKGTEPQKSLTQNILFSSVKVSLNQWFPLAAIAIVSMVYLQTANKLGVKPSNTFVHMGSMFAKVFLPMALVYTVFYEYVTREKYRLHADVRKEDHKTALLHAQYMIKNCFFMLLPPAVIFTFLADPFVKVFYTGQYKLSAKLLQTGGFLILFAGLACVLISILKAYGMDLHALGIQIGSFIAQLIFLSAMLKKSNGNSSVVLSSFYVYFTIQIVVAFILLYRFMRFDLVEMLLKLGKYGAAAIIMMILCILLDKFIMMNVFLIILSMVLGYLFYYLTILTLKGISKKDEQALKRTLNYYPVAFLKSRLHL